MKKFENLSYQKFDSQKFDSRLFSNSTALTADGLTVEDLKSRQFLRLTFDIFDIRYFLKVARR